MYLRDIIIKKKKLYPIKKYKVVNYISIVYNTQSLSFVYIVNSKNKFNLKTALSLLTSSNYKSSYSEWNITNFWFFLYQQYYLSEVFKLPIIFKTFNSQDVVPKSLLRYMVHSVKLIRWKKYYIIHSNEIIEVLFLCLWLKNIKLFMEWMRQYFEKTNLKKHRKLFLLLNLLLGKFMWNYNIFLQLKGLRVVLRGKFGKAGSVRKTRKYIRRGKCSYTAKNIALINQTNVIRTLTGVFSIKFEVFF